MKRYGVTWQFKEKICTHDNAQLALETVCKNNPTHPMVIDMKENPEFYINKAITELLTGTYQVSEYKVCMIREKGKIRKLQYTNPYDNMIQHMIVQIIQPILQDTLIYDTYASLEGKGLHLLNKRLKKELSDETGTEFCFKGDVKHFYENVNRRILMKLLKKKLKDPWLLSLIGLFIHSLPGEKGIAIGNYLSNLLSNYYLSPLDHYVQSLGMRLKRYADDFAILSKSKLRLHACKDLIRKFLWTHLRLHLKNNWQIFPVEARGIDFVGFVFRHKYTRIRKRVKISFIRACNRILDRIKHHIPIESGMMDSVISYLGFIKWGNARNLKNSHFYKIEPYLCLETDKLL